MVAGCVQATGRNVCAHQGAATDAYFTVAIAIACLPCDDRGRLVLFKENSIDLVAVSLCWFAHILIINKKITLFHIDTHIYTVQFPSING
jgi:hypothetical protein